MTTSFHPDRFTTIIPIIYVIVYFIILQYLAIFFFTNFPCHHLVYKVYISFVSILIRLIAHHFLYFEISKNLQNICTLFYGKSI